jgi:hypothetical protein
MLAIVAPVQAAVQVIIDQMMEFRLLHKRDVPTHVVNVG